MICASSSINELKKRSLIELARLLSMQRTQASTRAGDKKSKTRTAQNQCAMRERKREGDRQSPWLMASDGNGVRRLPWISTGAKESGLRLIEDRLDRCDAP